jgi:predicted RNA-binding Zn-ribbon protein involved in translation (DUF1610 family)
VPDGPGFDYTYYNTYTSIVGAFTGYACPACGKDIGRRARGARVR